MLDQLPLSESQTAPQPKKKDLDSKIFQKIFRGFLLLLLKVVTY